MPNDTIPRHASYEGGGVGLPRVLARFPPPGRPSPQGWSERYWRVSSTLISTRSPQVTRR